MASKVDGTTSMVVDTQVVLSPMDDSYLESLEEPWKSIAIQALPIHSSADESATLADATSRLDLLEVSVRSQLLRLIFDAEPSETVEKVGAFWTAALSLCLHMVHRASQSNVDPRYANMTPRKLPVLLIEDCLDALTVHDAKEFWAHYVEPSLDHPPHLLGELMWKSSNACHLPFLRVCNQFLRVLDTASYSDHYEWKGRVLIALSKGFSIADRSALKFWGAFNSSNVTDYENEETFSQTTGTPTKFEASGPSSSSSSSSKLDYSLYESFWSLQADFSNPNRIQVGAFIRKLKIVLEALESGASIHSTTNVTPVCTSIRYMTSSSLLPTQLATPQFRSTVLTQFLIAASHLSSESPALANALAPLLTRAKKLLQFDNPELYRLLWESILAHREDAWRKWKKEKCPVSAFAPKQKPESQTETIVSPDKDKNRLLMAGALGDSEAPADHEYESLQTEELLKVSRDLKKAIPSLEGHLEPYVEALDPDSGIEPEYHPKNDSLFAWRAMRLFAKHQLPLLKQCRRPADLERMTREWYRQQGKELPGEMLPDPPEEAVEEDDASDPAKPEDKGSEMEEDEGEKGYHNGGGHSSDDKHVVETTKPVDDVDMSDQNDHNHQEKNQSEKEESDNVDDEAMDRVSVEGNEKAGYTQGRDLAKRITAVEDEGDDDDCNKDQDSKSLSDDERLQVNDHKYSKESIAEELEDEGKKKGDLQDRAVSGKEEAASKERGEEQEHDAKESANNEILAIEASDDGDRSSRKHSSSRKRRRSRSAERDRNNAPQAPSREGNDDQDRNHRDWPRGPGNRVEPRKHDGPPRGRGRNDERDEGHPPRGGRGGGPPPPRQDDRPHPHGRGGMGSRRDDGPHGRPGRFDGQPPPRRQEDGLPLGRGGIGRGGDRSREGDRRRGRDDSRSRGRR